MINYLSNDTFDRCKQDIVPTYRWEIINFLIKKINAKKYLEIGVDTGFNFEKINCDYKVGVDPNINSAATIFKKSDDFFKTNVEKFDIIFVDGLHYADQVYRDINNSLSILNENGFIVCHDISPDEEILQLVPPPTLVWTGDCWKAWVKLRTERNDLSMFVVNTDYGCGVIKRGSQEVLNINDPNLYSYQFLEKNRKILLNLVDPADFCSFC